MEDHKKIETEKLVHLIEKLNVDIYGIADISPLTGMKTGLPLNVGEFLTKFPYAIVLGAQYGKFGKKSSGTEKALFLEDAAFHILNYIESKGYNRLIIHTEDEFDPIKRLGFMSLKMLAKTAGLGWQGRSLLTISHEYGPLHRLIAILTNMPLQVNQPVDNQCGTCRQCIDACPRHVLRFVEFEDHPSSREEVLDVSNCLGDNGCMFCILSCPWLKKPD